MINRSFDTLVILYLQSMQDNCKSKSCNMLLCGCKNLSDLKLNMNYFRYIQDSIQEYQG